MARFVIDVNLPYYFSVWKGPDFSHLRDLGDDWTDTRIWNYARQEGLTIVTKDTDFSDRVLLAAPPPRVIHIRLGNMKIREIHLSIAVPREGICDLAHEGHNSP